MPQLHTQSLNLYGMFYEVRRMLSETTAGFWTDLEIYNQLNQAQSYIARKTKCLQKTVTVTTSNGTQEYDLRSTTNSFSDIIDIAEDGVYYKINGTSFMPLKYRTKKQLDMEIPGWQGLSSSVPQYYYYNKATKTIGLVPKPNSSNAGAYLNITGFHFPRILHAGTAVSGTTAQIIIPDGSATLPYPSKTNSYYNNLYIEIYGGTGAGQNVKITEYTASTRVCLATFATAPDSTSVYGMIPQINEEAQYLMPLYALWKLWPKGGSRSTLGQKYKNEFMEGLSLFAGESLEEDDEMLVKDSYRGN